MSRRWIFTAAAVFTFMLLSAWDMRAQETASTSGIGLSASLQEGQFDILIPIWFSNSFSLAPAVGLASAEDGGSDIRLAIVPRYFFYKRDFAPYIGAKFGVLLASPENGTSTTDMLIGLAGGGEYFLDPHFSLGVEGQFNILMSDENSVRFGNPGKMNMNTAAAVFATVYF